jgi:hypothetical protein
MQTLRAFERFELQALAVNVGQYVVTYLEGLEVTTCVLFLCHCHRPHQHKHNWERETNTEILRRSEATLCSAGINGT